MSSEKNRKRKNPESNLGKKKKYRAQNPQNLGFMS